jgi:dipeptidyl aminopeptidase/acylaminoacyl peptidase
VGFSLAAVIAALLAAVAGGPQPAVEAPSGARLAFAVDSHRARDGDAVRSVGPQGGGDFRLAGGGASLMQLPVDWTSKVSWSADGERFAFSGAPPTAGRFGIYVGEADGSGVHLVPRSTIYHFDGAPIISPDGRAVVFLLPDGDTTWAYFSLPVDGGKLKRLTPSSREANEPSGFTADGKALGVTRQVPGEEQAATVALGSGRLTILAKGAAEPVFAVDGTALAVRNHQPSITEGGHVTDLTSSDLLLIPPGAPPQTVLSVKGGLAWPTIDPSGNRIAFTRLEGQTTAVLSNKSNEIDEVNADGTCLTKVLLKSGPTYAGTSWQPGPGRGVGPLSC